MTRFIGLVSLLALLALATTCNNRDSAPTTPTTPPATPAPTLVSVAINGPSAMQPGESRQFAAIATLSDKSTRDVTAEAVWRVGNVSVFTVTAGLVTATAAGEGAITAMYQNRGASLVVLSLPSGTGVLTGIVKEASYPIPGARIEVVGGPFAGMSTISDGVGSYRIYGLVGDLQIRASSAGYITQTVPINVAPFATPRRDQILHFNLAPSSRISSLAGTYRATLSPAGTCSASFTAGVGVRNYIATITQDGSALSVVLSGAEFGTISPGVVGNKFDGRAKPDSVEFRMGSSDYYYYYTWGIVERLGLPPPVGSWGIVHNLYLGFIGTATGPATPATISAALNGSLVLYDAPSGFHVGRRSVSSCYSPQHQLLMTRQ